jgi:molybdopterin/thiamine biosynthesis adenylyltransferase
MAKLSNRKVIIYMEISLIDSPTEDDSLIIIPDTIGDRYSTFGFISWWHQQRVRESTVMVIGAGALGNEVLKGLALMGVGRIFIVDFDTIEVGNLSRSVLFRAANAGESKAEVAARAVRELNPDVQVDFFNGDINTQLGLGVFRRMDAIVGCLDNREARLSVNRFCWQLNKPWIDGGIESLLGYARVFWPNRGACYECTLTQRDYQLIGLRLSCSLLARENLIRGKVPTTPTMAAIIGGIQTQEVLKIIHNMDTQPGINILFNGLTNESYKTQLPVRQDCLSHMSLETIVEVPNARIETTTAAELLQVASQYLGGKATLYPGHNIATGFHCHSCGQEENILMPLHEVKESQGICPGCGQQRSLEVIGELKGAEPIINEPLRRLGVPPLQILAASLGDRVIGLELTGDMETFFHFR